MRITITLNAKLWHLLQLRTLETGSSISQLIEDLKDGEDARKRKSEPAYAFDALVRDFQAKGLLGK